MLPEKKNPEVSADVLESMLQRLSEAYPGADQAPPLSLDADYYAAASRHLDALSGAENSPGTSKSETDLVVGDYALASHWSDGDPKDPWAVGFYAGTLDGYSPTRFNVVDGAGKPFRSNGFRRVEKISKERGDWIVRHTQKIESSGLSLWYFATCPLPKKFPDSTQESSTLTADEKAHAILKDSNLIGIYDCYRGEGMEVFEALLATGEHLLASLK